tara:strand:+ start:4852 stop:5472 length:621 start_codon:yes stop_codon:yes gene_type:complete
MIVLPTTELEAVNVMLSNIGESPVNTLEDDNVVDATVARTILKSISREVQSLGWNFNTDVGYTITKDSNNKFPVPANTAKIDTVDTKSTSSGTDFDVTLRGKYLYDRKNHTFNIDTDSVTVDLVVLLDFEDLPETARRYITLRAARIFQERHLGAAELSQFNAQDEARSLAAMRNDEVWQSDVNMISGSDTPLSIVTRFGFDRGIW